jgi:hypothetical protein
MKLKLPCMTVVTIAAVLCACSRGGEDKTAVQAAPETGKRAVNQAKEVAPPVASIQIPDADMPSAVGPVDPVPESLRGVWEKTDQPLRGMRIEFATATGMAAILVVAPPADDAEAVAFFAKKNGDDKERGVRFAACMPKVWTVGVVKYTDLKPAARDGEWIGTNELRLFRIPTCSDFRTKREDVALRLVSKDELVATMADPSRGITKTEIWKRVAP